NLNRLLPAVERIQTSTPQAGSRAATYHQTYPALPSTATCSGVDETSRFLQLATAVYGWMPRIIRVDPNHLERAGAALPSGRGSTDAGKGCVLISHIDPCLHSVVGASKLLHFANPKLFPIWDRNVEGFRLSATPSQHHMDQVKNYTAYSSEVHELRQAGGFSEFYRAFNDAFQERLRRLRISLYSLTEVRTIELAMFELASVQKDEGE